MMHIYLYMYTLFAIYKNICILIISINESNNVNLKYSLNKDSIISINIVFISSSEILISKKIKRHKERQVV